ncbi:hypothetical protein DPX16_14614 [Anabarilius grahami]|uniref:Uncharacterized protein n=1 Tax=Anabarilius grahami TaxID=495550 RepID=A0A3N0YYP2_ANAGA|nr:hypothetical protein DPX16_14614 [Anabarilius grahami]
MAEAIQELNRAGGNVASEPMARDQEENASVDSLDHELNRLQETMERLSLEKQQRHLTKRARNLRRNLEEDKDEYYQRRRARSASPLGRHRKGSPHEEYRRISGTLRLVKIPPEDPMWGKGVPRLRRREEEVENAEEDADQETQEGEGSGDPGEGPSNVVAEPSSREAEQLEIRDEMRGQHEDPQASETEQEGPDTGPAAGVPTEPTATDPEPSGDQSPEAGPSTDEQPQPNGFLAELQGIDLPTADSDSPDIDLPDLSHTGDFPTLSLRDLEEIIGSAPTQDD